MSGKTYKAFKNEALAEHMRLPLFRRLPVAAPLFPLPPPLPLPSPPPIREPPRVSSFISKLKCASPRDNDCNNGGNDSSSTPPPAPSPSSPSPPATTPPPPTPPAPNTVPPAPSSQAPSLQPPPSPPPPPPSTTPSSTSTSVATKSASITQSPSALSSTSQTLSPSDISSSTITTSSNSASSSVTFLSSSSSFSSSSLSSETAQGSSLPSTTLSSVTSPSAASQYTAVPDQTPGPSAAPGSVDFNRTTTVAAIITSTLVSIAIFFILGFCAFRRRKQIKAAYQRRRGRGSQSSISANFITNPLIAPDRGSNAATVGVMPVVRRPINSNSTRPRSSASMIAPKSRRGTMGMIRRLLTAPLSPLTPWGGWSSFGRSKNSAGDEEAKVKNSSEHPPRVSLDIDTRDLEPQPAYDKHGQPIAAVTEKLNAPPQTHTRAGMSFFSWSSPSVSPPVATPAAAARRATRSNSVRFSRRDTTVPSDSSHDSEPARFRTVKSWVAHQQQRYTRQSYRRMPEDKDDVEEVPKTSQEHTRKISNPNERDTAAFKFGFSQTSRTESPETRSTDSESSPMSASPIRQVAMAASRAQNPHIVNIPSRELSQRGRLDHPGDSPPQIQQSSGEVHFNPVSSNNAQQSSTMFSDNGVGNGTIRGSIPHPPPPIPTATTAAADHTRTSREGNNSGFRPTSQNTATTSRTTLTIFRTHPGEKWEYRGPKLGKGDRRIDSGVLDRLRKAGWGSITRDSR